MLGFLLLTASAFGQSSSHPSRPSNPVPSGQTTNPPFGQMPSGTVTQDESQNPMDDKILRQRLKALDEQRQKQLVEDTNRLLALATELKEEVDKTNKDTLSLSVLKKAEQIEKLAKSVKDKMKADRLP
jgi:hypothetical protein